MDMDGDATAAGETAIGMAPKPSLVDPGVTTFRFPDALFGLKPIAFAGVLSDVAACNASASLLALSSSSSLCRS